MNGEKLRDKRKAKGFSQQDVAKAIGMAAKNYSLKENSKVEFRRDEIEAIKNLLKLTDKDVIEIFFKV